MVRSALGAKRPGRLFGSCLFFASFFLAACGDDDEKPDHTKVTIYCRAPVDGPLVVCLEGTVEKDDADSAEDGCLRGGGMLAESCPTENIVGDCVQEADGLVSHYYSEVDAELGQQLCVALGGTWVPRP